MYSDDMVGERWGAHATDGVSGASTLNKRKSIFDADVGEEVAETAPPKKRKLIFTTYTDGDTERAKLLPPTRKRSGSVHKTNYPSEAPSADAEESPAPTQARRKPMDKAAKKAFMANMTSLASGDAGPRTSSAGTAAVPKQSGGHRVGSRELGNLAMSAILHQAATTGSKTRGQKQAAADAKPNAGAAAKARRQGN